MDRWRVVAGLMALLALLAWLPVPDGGEVTEIHHLKDFTVWVWCPGGGQECRIGVETPLWPECDGYHEESTRMDVIAGQPVVAWCRQDWWVVASSDVPPLMEALRAGIDYGDGGP